MEQFGIDEESASALIIQSVHIAERAKNEVQDAQRRGNGTQKDLLVAASIGPYGACQAGGEEYHGDYGKEMGEKALEEWHR